MTINVKIINQTGGITTSAISDDPTDAEISKALGATENESTIEVLSIYEWEIHKLKGNESLLVIGKAPKIDAPIQKRKSCDLNDEQLKELAIVVKEFAKQAKAILG